MEEASPLALSSGGEAGRGVTLEGCEEGAGTLREGLPVKAAIGDGGADVMEMPSLSGQAPKLKIEGEVISGEISAGDEGLLEASERRRGVVKALTSAREEELEGVLHDVGRERGREVKGKGGLAEDQLDEGQIRSS